MVEAIAYVLLIISTIVIFEYAYFLIMENMRTRKMKQTIHEHYDLKDVFGEYYISSHIDKKLAPDQVSRYLLFDIIYVHDYTTNRKIREQINEAIIWNLNNLAKMLHDEYKHKEG